MVTDWQWHYLTEDYTEPVVAGGTLRIKLPVREQISVIEFECRAEIKAIDYDNKIIDVPTKIEVIGDGSSVLYSCSPETAAFLHMTQIGRMPNMLFGDKVGFSDHYRVKLCFGRWMRDEEYGLDTSVYNNVYLEIPWTLDAVDYTLGTFAHTIRYLRPIEKLPWKGFIRSRDIEYGSHVFAIGHYYVDLPLKYPWYLLGCRIYDIDADLAADIPHIKLDIDDGRYVLVDEDTDDLITMNTERFVYPVHVHHKVVTSTADGSFIRTYMGRCESVTALPAAVAVPFAFVPSFTGQKLAYTTYEKTATTETAGDFNWEMFGNSYMCCLVIKDWHIPPEHGVERFNPFPVGEHSEADIDFTTIAVTVDDLRTFLQEVCPLKI